MSEIYKPQREEGTIGQYESPERRVARRGEGMKKGVERRPERGSVTSSAREATDLWDKKGHIPWTCLPLQQETVWCQGEEAQTCDSGEMTQSLPSSTTKPDHRA